MKIGITGLFKPNDSIWKNGIAQNVLMLYDILNKIDIVDKVTILNVNIDLESKDGYLKDYDFLTMSTSNLEYIRETYDVLITLAATPPSNWLDHYKEKKSNKVIFYKGGNAFINQIEMVLYGQFKGWPNVDLTSKKLQEYYQNVDEVWMVPQQEFHNKDYFEITYKTTSRVVPFVWSDKFVKESADNIQKLHPNETPYFDDKKIDKWRLVSFEPNMSLLKNMMPIINYTEHAYRIMDEDLKNKFDRLIITNGAGHRNNKELIDSIGSMDLFKDKKIAFDGRFPIVYILSRFSEMVVSHQWGNALNYAYLDACYFGMPLIHNAHLCKDLGYYFEDWKLKDASDLIIKAMRERIGDKDYTKRQRDILKRYTIENLEMIESYKKLLLNLWAGSYKELTYDWKTNTMI
jgi:hypothetical protein